MELVDQAAAVTLGGIGNLPTFYINKRAYSDGIWTVECLDRAAFLDVVIDGITKTGGKYSTAAIASRAETVCGLSAVSLPVGMPSAVEPEFVDGCTYQQFFQKISEVFCGFFCITGTNALDFIGFGDVQSQDTATAWSEIHDTGTFRYGAVELTNGTLSDKIGSGAFPLEINNDLVDVTASDPYQTLIMTDFTGWSVDSFVSGFGDLPYIGGTVTFGTTTLRATRVDAHIAGGALVISAGGDIPQYGEIDRKGLLQRQLDAMVSTGKTYGTMHFAYQDVTVTPNK